MSLFGLVDNKIDLWINIGQSNCVGVAPQAEFPSEYTGHQYGNISQNTSHLTVNKLVYASGDWSFRFTTYRDLAEYRNKPQFHVHAPVSGTDLGYTAGAVADWNILSTATYGSGKALANRLLDSMDVYVQQAITDLAAANVGYRIKGVLWSQGEADAINLSFVNAYAQNFKDLRDYIRTLYGLPNLPFIIARTHNNFVPPRAYIDTVRQAQMDCSNQSTNPTFYDANTYIFSTDSYGLNVDTVHFNGLGQQAQGEDFLTIMKTL